MLFKRINRSDPEKIFIVVYQSYATASLTNGQAVIWDYATDANGVGVTKPTDGTGRASHYGTAFAGIAAETIAAGDYGLLQVYGYHSAVRVRTHTGGNPAIAAGTALTCLDAIFALASFPPNDGGATSTVTLSNAHWVGFALAAQASFTTKAIACFIKGL
jgi:hypothetical protein